MNPPPSPAGDRESAYYLVDGADGVIPTILTQGPWDPTAQHGGPVCGLLAWAAEQVPTLVPMQLSRLTVDLWRPVPLRRLRIERAVRREGKRLQAVDVSLFDGETEVAHASALRIRRGDTSHPEIVDHPRQPKLDSPVGPTHPGTLFAGPAAERIGFVRSIEAHRVVGPATKSPRAGEQPERPGDEVAKSGRAARP